MTPPLDLYMDTIALQRAANTQTHPVETEITRTLNDIWSNIRLNQRGEQRPNQRGGRRPNQRGGQRPKAPLERLQERASNRAREIKELLAQRTDPTRTQGQRRRNTSATTARQHQWKATTLLAKGAEIEWQQQWQAKARGKKATTWRTPWDTHTLPLYEGLSKAEATALFLMRVEVIGLNAWLAAVQVPDILPRCQCGWQAQTVRHILIHCPRYNRSRVIQAAQSESLYAILTQPKSARIAAKWLIEQNILQQFGTAKAIDKEDTNGFSPFQDLDRWVKE